ncbi:MAG: hypothetical protein ACRDVP_11275 [Acidimicrobiales bacterium]
MWLVAASVTVSGALMSACGGSSASALAQQACSKVQSSLKAYEASTRTDDQSLKQRLLHRAEEDLQAAEPLAAAATSADGQWNALMTTLNEAGQVDESHLVAALRAQCQSVSNQANPTQTTPITFPPPP